MDNEIAEHLPDHMAEAGYHAIEIINADEVYKKGESDFADRAGIWSVVALSRGRQMVQSGYISGDECLQAIEDHDAWIRHEAELMIMKLKEIRAKI